MPTRDRTALASLRPLRGPVGHALPGLRQSVAAGRCACLPTLWRSITTGRVMKAALVVRMMHLFCQHLSDCQLGRLRPSILSQRIVAKIGAWVYNPGLAAPATHGFVRRVHVVSAISPSRLMPNWKARRNRLERLCTNSRSKVPLDGLPGVRSICTW